MANTILGLAFLGQTEGGGLSTEEPTTQHRLFLQTVVDSDLP